MTDRIEKRTRAYFDKPIEGVCLLPVEGLYSIDPDVRLLEVLALLPPVDLLLVEGVVGPVGVAIANHHQGPRRSCNN